MCKNEELRFKIHSKKQNVWLALAETHERILQKIPQFLWLNWGFLCKYLPNFQADGVILLLQREWNQSAAVLTSVLPKSCSQSEWRRKRAPVASSSGYAFIYTYIQEQMLEFFHLQPCLFNRFIKIKVTICLQLKKNPSEGAIRVSFIC